MNCSGNCWSNYFIEQEQTREWYVDFVKYLANNEVERIKDLLENIPVPEMIDDRGNNLLHYVSKTKNNEAVATQLIEAGCNVNHRNKNNEPPLITAMQHTNVQMAKMLLDAGADYNNAHFNFNFGPLHTAANNNAINMMKVLVESGANICAVDKRGRTPLHIASCPLTVAGRRKYGIVEKRIKAGWGINAKDHNNQTDLHYTGQNKSKESLVLIVKELIKAGSDVNARDRRNETPLLYAVKNENGKSVVPIIKELIRAGSDVNAKNCRGETPLHYAVINRNEEITVRMIKELIKAGSDVHAKDITDQTPLHHAFKNENENLAVLIIKELIKAGSDINAHDRCNRRPLHLAVEHEYEKIVDLLVKAGAKVSGNDSDNKFQPIFYFATSNNKSLPLIKRLISIDTSIDYVNENGDTALHCAAGFLNFETMKFLINSGASVHVLNHQGLDPLCLILKKYNDVLSSISPVNGVDEVEEPIKQLKCIELLLDNGADINRRNQNGLTPLHVVLSGTRRCTIVRKLLNRGATLDFAHTVVDEIMESSMKNELHLVLIEHAAMLEAQNRNNELLNFDPGKLKMELQDYYVLCREELNLMKTLRLCDRVTIFQMLMDRNIRPYMRNQEITSAFEAQIFSTLYPIYGDLLIKRFLNELERQNLERVATAVLSRVAGWDVNAFPVILDNITCHLSINDLANLSLV